MKLFKVEIYKLEYYSAEENVDVMIRIGVDANTVENSVYEIAESMYDEILHVKATEIRELDGYNVLLKYNPKVNSTRKQLNNIDDCDCNGIYNICINYDRDWIGYTIEDQNYNLTTIAKSKEDAKSKAIKNFERCVENAIRYSVLVSEKYTSINNYDLVFEKQIKLINTEEMHE